jgi:RNA-directed DNA polymerase
VPGLTPIVEPTFAAASVGFRPARAAHQAVQAGRHAISEGYRRAVDSDVKKCVDNVNVDGLRERRARKMADRALRHWIGR